MISQSKSEGVVDAGARVTKVTDLLSRVRSTEIPEPEVALSLARAYFKMADLEKALAWCLRVTDAEDDYTHWHSAGQLLKRILPKHIPPTRRALRLAVLGSYTTSQLVDCLRLIALRRGIMVDVYEAGFGLYRQEILDPDSGLHRFRPDAVLIATHEGELRLPIFSDDPEWEIERETERWTSLWEQVQTRLEAQIIQTNFVIRPEDPFGHLATRLKGSHTAMVRELNTRLGEAAGDAVAIVDCESLASLHGKRLWFDDRYWYHSKQAVGLLMIPQLARHITAVIAGTLGLARKCLVLDLDGTLWGGTVGEDGLEGIALGHGADGEAYVAFQQYLRALKERGIVLAVCSKNDEDVARAAFEQHPYMVLKKEDVAVFVANWDPKPQNLQLISETLKLGLDSLTFVDDQPAERDAVRQALPEVDVISLPTDPAYYVSALTAYPFFETNQYTGEDAVRTRHYQARAQTKALQSQAASLEEFLTSLEMRALYVPFNDMNLARIIQLIGKTNQFNLTNRRHSLPAVRQMMNDPDMVHVSVRLIDRFTDHGLVGVLIGRRNGETMEIDTFLMSCRVIGRTLEQAMLLEFSEKARKIGCTRIRGIYRPTEKNGLVANLYRTLGFAFVEQTSEQDVWELDLSDSLTLNPYIQKEDNV